MSSRLRISDHALLRYLERVMGVDVDAARGELAKIVSVAEDHPTALGIRVDGWRYVIREGQVVTVHKASLPDLRTGRQRPERRDDASET